MGLDITAYERVELVRERDGQNDDGYDEGLVYLYPFPGQGFEGREGPIRDGLYRSLGNEVRFSAGSYGGYNHWREELARMVGHPSQPPGPGQMPHFKGHSQYVWSHAADAAVQASPFFELINFADNEGVIAGDAARRIRDAFGAWAERAEAFAGEMEPASMGVYWWDRYQRWRGAFDLAADAGCVAFH